MIPIVFLSIAVVFMLGSIQLLSRRVSWLERLWSGRVDRQ